MKIPANAALKSIEASVSDFAGENIAPLKDLGTRISFPEDLWVKMGKENLLNPELSGGGSPCLSITRGGMAMVSKGGNLGMALSWMMHHLTARYLFSGYRAEDSEKSFGSLLQRISRGSATAGFAVSEPGAGAHPKYMTASASSWGSGYIINGEKTYLTNGPIACGFITIAITGYEGKMKRFSAFFIPADTAGIKVLPPINTPFFRPSPHNSIILKDCKVPESALMGEKGEAFTMVLAFRGIEDAAMTGPVTGAMAFILDSIRAACSTKHRSQSVKIAQLESLQEKAELMSWSLAEDLDRRGQGSSVENHRFKALVAQFLECLETLISETQMVLPDACTVLVQDLKLSGRFAGEASLKGKSCRADF